MEEARDRIILTAAARGDLPYRSPGQKHATLSDSPRDKMPLGRDGFSAIIGFKFGTGIRSTLHGDFR